ncbi:MAG TPA: hypothetical protein PKE04_23065, partial [Clostridia bacterium]|nr:hypothetical protein [Clostridia bacterium]
PGAPEETDPSETEDSEFPEEADSSETREQSESPEETEDSEEAEAADPSESEDVQAEETGLAAAESKLPAVIPEKGGKGGGKRPRRRKLRFWRTLFWTLFFIALAGVAVGIEVL